MGCFSSLLSLLKAQVLLQYCIKGDPSVLWLHTVCVESSVYEKAISVCHVVNIWTYSGSVSVGNRQMKSRRDSHPSTYTLNNAGGIIAVAGVLNELCEEGIYGWKFTMRDLCRRRCWMKIKFGKKKKIHKLGSHEKQKALFF